MMLSSLVLLYACKQSDEGSSPTDDTVVSIPKEIKSVSGLDDQMVVQNEYFHPLKNVEVINEKNQNIAHLFQVVGHVNYGVLGDYVIHYELNYGDETLERTRTITVAPGTIQRETFSRTQIPGSEVNLDGGIYRIGNAPQIDHPVHPQFINQDLLKTAVPSNGWWTSLLVQNYGGGNGIYTNPLRSAFSNFGAEITNPGAGFVQYWNPDGYNTMANFSLALPDMYVKTTALSEGYQTYVVDYSDTTVSVAMRNTGQPQDHMVLTYAQGSPFVFAEVSNQGNPYISLAEQGASGFEFFTVDGKIINSNEHIGSGIIIKINQKHIGYQTSRPAQVGQPTYGDRYFLVSAPEDTRFGFTSNRINLTMAESNIFSIAAIQSLSEGVFYHGRAYSKTLKGDVSYEVDHKLSVVDTTYHFSTQQVKGTTHVEPIQFLLPHHYLNSDQELLTYQFETVRGFLRLMEGASFTTRLSFHGLLPAMTLPTNSEFSEIHMATYLQDLRTRTEIADETNFLNDEGPYWNSKAIYPLAQGIIIADQMGDEELKADFISRLRYVLTDWYQYEGTSDERYLYYNERWGSVYYSNNDFNTATELSDHAFTHGYLVYASSVLAMYDASFVEDYGQMVDLLLRDYMHPVKDDYTFEYLRSFDPWAGHTWAHGFGTFAEGNNIESSSEAIQSWVGGYLWALQTGDLELRDAAIYGFVHELSSAKTYMFDYEDVVFKENYKAYASVAGMIWGGKYDYATWFGANPTFIYGIQWLPNGEYISNYALNETEKAKLTSIYQDYLSAKQQNIDTWFANMWSIQALIDPVAAINQFDAQKILNDDYPSDLSQTYYLIHGLRTYGNRTTAYTMELSRYVSSSIYMNQAGEVHAMIWNPSHSERSVTFNGPNGSTQIITIQARSFTSVKLG